MALLTKKSVNEIDVTYMYALDKETKKIYAKLKQKNNESLTQQEKETLITGLFAKLGWKFNFGLTLIFYVIL